jgi:hypothetical protein
MVVDYEGGREVGRWVVRWDVELLEKGVGGVVVLCVTAEVSEVLCHVQL